MSENSLVQQFRNNQLIGISDILDAFFDATSAESTTYPPRNIIKYNDGSYRLELAVAGFTKDEIKVTTEEDVLTIVGIKESKDSEETVYVHRGIGLRNFRCTFKLATYFKVSKVSMENGILSIEVDKVLPAGKKLKEYDIE